MIRKLSALALLLPLTTAGLVVGAAPAFAAGSITDPVDGATFGADTTIAIRASYSTTDRTELRLKSPAGAEQVVKAFSGGTLTAQSGTLDYALDTSCATYPSPSCSGRAPALNGIWGVRLVGGAVDSSTFVLRIPPRVPASFTAQPDGYRAVVLSWRKGDEPDLVGWTLYEGGGVAVPSVGLDACNGTSCATTVTYASDGTGYLGWHDRRHQRHHRVRPDEQRHHDQQQAGRRHRAAPRVRADVQGFRPQARHPEAPAVAGRPAGRRAAARRHIREDARLQAGDQDREGQRPAGRRHPGDRRRRLGAGQ
ncbi:MAG: hypothetical protein LC779_07945 [Actinobacteria bacterium]|nr:hypothetical protein [Actinomycetota bacterium]